MGIEDQAQPCTDCGGNGWVIGHGCCGGSGWECGGSGCSGPVPNQECCPGCNGNGFVEATLKEDTPDA